MEVRFQIGDWSDDGHGKCDSFIVDFHVHDLNRIREAHYKAKEVLGFDIGDLCARYEESTIEGEKLERLFEIGVLSEKKLNEELLEFDRDEQSNIVSLSPDAYEMCQIWVDILNHIDPELKGEIIPEDPIPTINFYGVDQQGRHVYTPGYGLFY